jgi:hypothetical protein
VTAYCILSIDTDEDPFEVNYVSEFNSFLGTTSSSEVQDALTFSTLEEAKDVHRQIVILDRHFWPPCNPLIAEISPDGVQKVLDTNLTEAGKEFAREVETALRVSS